MAYRYDGVELRDMRADEIAPGDCKVGVVNGRPVAIFNLDGNLYAIQADCTHRGGPLCEGGRWGEIVTCPWHGSEFNIRTGEVLTGPAEEPIQTYKVSVEAGRIILTPEERAKEMVSVTDQEDATRGD